ncbi:MAG: S8 family serine peptidase [Candidatus Sericytochromatia bacterium]|nr:S8 family serine peptidase [Candidatus Sericytochromatia bacterium]
MTQPRSRPRLGAALGALLLLAGCQVPQPLSLAEAPAGLQAPAAPPALPGGAPEPVWPVVAPDPASPARPATREAQPAHAPDRLIVGLRPGVSAARFLAEAGDDGLTLLRDADWDGRHVLTLRVRDRTVLGATRARLAALSAVTSVDLDVYARPHLVPTDPLYPEQWGHHPAFGNTEGAWDKLTGVDQSKVIVAVIDSGIDFAHEEFRVTTQGDRLIGGRNVTPKPDGLSGTAEQWAGVLADELGHGTLTAGIIGAIGNNGKGTAGVAWTCRIMPIKADSYDDQGRTTFLLSDVIEAMRYAATYEDAGGARVRVINMSLGANTGRVIPIYNDAVSFARSKGILVVASTGNQGAPYVAPPANTPGVLAVGATGTYMGTEFVAHYSNYGPRLDLVAPGSSTRAPIPNGPSQVGSVGQTPQTGYAVVSGTSEAAPYVAGVAALVFAKYDQGNASVASSNDASAMVDKVRLHLMASTDDFGTPGWDPSWGYGRLNADKALTPQALQGLSPTEARKPVLE